MSKPRRRLSSEAEALLAAKGRLWEYRLFAQVLSDEVAARRSLRAQVDSALPVATGTLAGRAALQWLGTQVAGLAPLTGRLNALVNADLDEALGPLGQAGDAERIVAVAQEMGDIYGRILQWTIDCRRGTADPQFQRLLEITSRLSAGSLAELESFAGRINGLLDEAQASKGPRREYTLTFTQSAPDLGPFEAELQLVAASLGIPEGAVASLNLSGGTVRSPSAGCLTAAAFVLVAIGAICLAVETGCLSRRSPGNPGSQLEER